LYEWALNRWHFASSTGLLFEFWIPFGGGICVLWCLGSAFSGRITAQFSDGSRAVLIAVLVTQIMLSLWWTRDFWLWCVHDLGSPQPLGAQLLMGGRGDARNAR